MITTSTKTAESTIYKVPQKTQVFPKSLYLKIMVLPNAKIAHSVSTFLNFPTIETFRANQCQATKLVRYSAYSKI